jgi:hypothetical protein
MNLSLKPWRSDITKGVIVTSLFVSGVHFGLMSILAPFAVNKLIELGYPQNPLVLTCLMMFFPTVWISIAIHFLNKEFTWRGTQ